MSALGLLSAASIIGGAPGAGGNPAGAPPIASTATSSAKSSSNGYGAVNGAFTFKSESAGSNILPIIALAAAAIAVGVSLYRGR